MGDKSSLEVMARLTGTPINVKDIVEDWILITYDLPHTEEGDKARREFLLSARSIGASRHTDSVYLLPRNPQAEVLALELSRVKNGEVVIWYSEPADKTLLKELTETYDKGLEPILDEISERLDKTEEHLALEHYKRAEKMRGKTVQMLQDMTDAVFRRGSEYLYLKLLVLKRRFEAMGG